VGNKKNPIWRVVVADQRSPRDGRSIETLGHYNPQTQPSTIVINRERLDFWLERGAQPTGTVKKLLRAPNTEMAAPPAPAPVEEATTAAGAEQAEAPADVAAASEPDPEAPTADEAPAETETSKPDPEAPGEPETAPEHETKTPPAAPEPEAQAPADGDPESA
jgi:small subunit ribosomal protein S16